MRRMVWWWALVAAAAVGLAGGGSGHAAEAPVELVGLAGRTFDEAVLVGCGGEIYRRHGGSWQRQTLGGTAATLVSARGVTPTEIWAIGDQPPPWRFDGYTWSATPVTLTGTAVMSSGGAPAVGIGRRVLVRSQGKWVTLATTGAPSLTAVWASGPKEAVVVTGDGQLKRFDGTSWKVLAATFAAGETPRRLFAGPAGPVYVAGDAGTLLRVSGATVTAMKLEARLTSFQPAVAAAAQGKPLMMVGDAVVEAKSVRALVKLDGTGVVLVDSLPALPAGDAPVAMLAATDGGVLVASRAGTVLLRAAAGGWTSEPVDRTPPARRTVTANPPAQTR